MACENCLRLTIFLSPPLTFTDESYFPSSTTSVSQTSENRWGPELTLSSSVTPCNFWCIGEMHKRQYTSLRLGRLTFENCWMRVDTLLRLLQVKWFKNSLNFNQFISYTGFAMDHESSTIDLLGIRVRSSLNIRGNTKHSPRVRNSVNQECWWSPSLPTDIRGKTFILFTPVSRSRPSTPRSWFLTKKRLWFSKKVQSVNVFVGLRCRFRLSQTKGGGDEDFEEFMWDIYDVGLRLV